MFEIAMRDNTQAGERQHYEASPPWLAKIQERAQVFRFGHRYAISALGQGFVYGVSKGVAALECTAATGARVVTQLLYPGDILVPDLQAPLHEPSLTAKRPVEFWKLTITSFADESMSNGPLWQAVFLRLNAQNARAQLHIAAMSALNCEQRIAGFLIEIACRLGVHTGDTISFELPLSRYGIAAYLSLNADTVSRAFSALTAARIIERRGRFQMSIRDWNALVEMCPMSEAIIKLHDVSKSRLRC